MLKIEECKEVKPLYNN